MNLKTKLKLFLIILITSNLLLANEHLIKDNLAQLRTIDEPILIKKEEPKTEQAVESLPSDSKELLSKLAKINNLEATFSQVEQSIDNNSGQVADKKKVIKGKLKIAKPNMFYWDVKSPDSEQQVYITNGYKFWHYDKNLEQVVKDNFDSRRITNSPFYFLFSEPENLINKFEIKKINNNIYKLISKKDAGFDSNYISDLQLTFNNDNDDLENISFIAAKNKKVNLDLESVKINSKIGKNEFNFNIPKGVDIIDANEIY